MTVKLSDGVKVLSERERRIMQGARIKLPCKKCGSKDTVVIELADKLPRVCCNSCGEIIIKTKGN